MAFFLMSGCTDNIVFNQYKSIEDASWSATKNIDFEFSVSDTTSANNLFINLRNNSNYSFSNLYLITTLKFPNSTSVIDTLQYEMTTPSGAFLGTGFSEIKDNKLFYRQQKVFPFSGNYIFSVRHAMRKNGEIHPIKNLEGIQEVGFSIEKTK